MWGLTSAVSVIAMSGALARPIWFFSTAVFLCEIETCSTLTPNSRRRFPRHHLLSSGRPPPPRPRLAPDEGEYRRSGSDQRSQDQAILDSFGACPMVRLVKSTRLPVDDHGHETLLAVELLQNLPPQVSPTRRQAAAQ